MITLFSLNSCENDLLDSRIDNLNDNVSKLAQLLTSLESPDSLAHTFYIYKAKTEFLIYDEVADTNITASGDQNDYYYAYFTDNAGDVEIDGNLLNSDGGSYWSFDDSITLNGDSCLVDVEGSANIDDFSFYIELPYNFANIVSPENGIIHDDDNSLTITWTAETSYDMSVVIELSNQEPDSNSTHFDYKITDDDGSYTFSSAYLQAFQKGMLSINLRRGNYVFGIDNNGLDYGAFAFSQHQIMIKLTE